MKSFTTHLLCLIATVAFSISANAYTTFSCSSGNASWSNKNQILYAYTGSFPSGSSWRSALQEAVTRLNANPAGFTFTINYTSTPPALGNGRNEVWIQNISPPGITYSWWNGACNLTEADIMMDSSVSWTTSTNKTNNFNYGGSARPFQATLLHELGHALGLGHEADEYNIMGQDWNHIHTNGNTSRAHFGEDAGDGAVYLYGSTSRQDLGVVHWRRTGASGDYSTHSKTRLLNPSTGAELPYSISGGERRYNVTRGQTVRLEMTYENNGNSYQYEDVRYVVSSNSTISTLDRTLANRSLGLSPDSVYTSSYNVTIPTDLTCNRGYWLGAIIDADNSISENQEWNNASYLPIYVNWSIHCYQITIDPPIITPPIIGINSK